MTATVQNRSYQSKTNLYDGALATVLDYGPYLTNGFARHDPMVIEALHTMGQGGAIAPWLDAERDKFLPVPVSDAAISSATLSDHLGSRSSYGAWIHYFEAEISSSDWKQVLGEWVSRLQAGLAADATHGIIRVGHIARALQEEVTPTRLQELARALAYWASCHAVPHFVFDSYSNSNSPDSILERLPLVPGAKRENGGAVSVAVHQTVYADGFAEAVRSAAITDDFDQAVLTLARLYARLFLTSASTHIQAIAFAHPLTSLAAVVNLRPLIDDETATNLTHRTWEVACAMHSAYSEHSSLDAEIHTNVPTPGELIDAAVDHGDDHVIKLTDACLQYQGLSGDAIFAASARHSASVSAKRAY